MDGVHEKMTWPGWKGVVGGGASVCLLLFHRRVFLLGGETGAPGTGLPQAGWHRRLVVVGRGLRHGLWRRVQRVRKVWRVRQRTLGLGSPPVCHEPAGNGYCHGDQRKQSGDHQGNDETELGQTDTVNLLDFRTRFSSGCHLVLLLLKGQDGIGLHHDFLSKLPFLEGGAHLQVCAWRLSTPSSAKGVYTVAVYRWTRSEADSNVALESQVVAAGKLEGIEACHQHLVLRIVLPVVKYRPVGGTAVGVGHLVLRLFLIVHSLGNAATCKATIDLMWLNCDFEEQVVSDLSTADLLAVHSADLHLTSWWRTRVGDRARCGNHADIESQGHSLFTGVVDTLDVVRPGAVRHQLGVFLDDQHEGGLPVDVYQATGVEEHLEVDRLTLAAGHEAAALGVLAVALDVDDSVEAVQLNQHLYSIGQAHNIKATWRNIRTGRFCPWWGRNSSVAAVDLVIRVTDEVGRADTYGDVVCDCAQRAWTTNVARWYALMSVDVTLLVQGTIIIGSAFLCDSFTSTNEWITDGARGADTVIASWQVDALRSRCTWIVNRDTFVDVSTNSVRLELVSSWAHTEALLWANIDAVFVLRARVGGRAVPACQDTVLSNTVIVWWASTSAA